MLPAGSLTSALRIAPSVQLFCDYRENHIVSGKKNIDIQ